MKRFWLSAAAMAVLSACSGGNPFAEQTDTDDTTSTIPPELVRNLESVSYDPAAQTLTVTGIALDDTPLEAIYRRRPGLDTGNYEAYTVQDSSLDRHTTAYIREIDGARAAIVVTGVQFEHYFGGTVYTRNGAYSPPDITPTTGLVSYAGAYVGLLNGPGRETDLLPVTPGTPTSPRPVQAARVVGQTLINADFAQNIVNGLVYDRVAQMRSGDVNVEDMALAPTAIQADGSFTGDVTVELQDRGTYGGIFGGTGATSVAGTLFVEDHIGAFQNEEETGLFVLAQCGTPNEDPICNQPNP